MASPKKKFYVVWQGMTTGVFSSWCECESAIKGFPNAKYKSFPTLQAAEIAYRDGATEHWGVTRFVSELTDEQLAAIGRPIQNSLCVDAAWNSETKEMEYRGVWHHDGSLAFQQGPFQNATNNIGEFLAIVHGLAMMAKRQIDWPIYSDSQTAIAWVRNRVTNSKSMRKGETSDRINELVTRAERWLSENQFRNQILKWETTTWGEVPADYGRK